MYSGVIASVSGAGFAILCPAADHLYSLVIFIKPLTISQNEANEAGICLLDLGYGQRLDQKHVDRLAVALRFDILLTGASCLIAKILF